MFFWETNALATGFVPFIIFGLIFVFMGIYVLVGRFFADAYMRSKTSYAITNQRILILRNLGTRSLTTLALSSVQEISLEQARDGSGSITFGSPLPFSMFFASWYRAISWPGMNARLSPTFDLIPNVVTVYEIVKQARQPSQAT